MESAPAEWPVAHEMSPCGHGRTSVGMPWQRVARAEEGVEAGDLGSERLGTVSEVSRKRLGSVSEVSRKCFGLQEALRRQEPRRERLKVGVAAQGREVDLLVGRPLDARRAEDGQLACRARPHAVGREAQPAKVHRHARHEVEVAAGEGGEDLVALQVELGEEEGRLGLQLEAEAAAQLLRLLV